MKIKTILGIALAAGSLASCSVEDNDTVADNVKENYTREFIKQFGTINPNQDWSVVEQKSITVNLPKASHVQVFEKQGDEFRLAADYEGVTKQTITFDGMEGDNTPFLVYIDSDAAYAVENGGTLTVGSATSGPKRATKIPSDCKWITRGNKTIITLSSTESVMKILAENNGKDNSGYLDKIPAGNRGLVQNTDPISFYPLYWNSKNKHVAGIYYNDETTNQLVHIPVYADKADTYKDDADKEDLCFYTTNNTLKDYPAETDAEDCWKFTHTYNYALITRKWNVSYEENFKFYSRPYTITPTKSLAAGIYVEVNGHKYYSDPNLNDGKNFFAIRPVTEGNGSDKTYTYLCFDDPDDNDYTAEGDHDFNDLVLYTPRQMTPVTRNETEWTIACEDLGGTFDYDFNDLVFRVTHVAGNDYARIYPVAAGGTLPAYLYYNDKPISEEWHSHFGHSGYESNVMINTGKGSEEHGVKTILVKDLPTDWSITAFSKTDGGLNIKVKRADNTWTTVTGPEKGAAPQMLILPYDWQWPTELTRITTAYPDFGTWGENYQSSSWVNNKVSDYIITGFGEKEITSIGQKEYSVK